jgi:hypothetical protein
MLFKVVTALSYFRRIAHHTSYHTSYLRRIAHHTTVFRPYWCVGSPIPEFLLWASDNVDVQSARVVCPCGLQFVVASFPYLGRVYRTVFFVRTFRRHFTRVRGG